jgi:hypothetical protein
MGLNPKSGNNRAKLLPTPVGGPEEDAVAESPARQVWDDEIVHPLSLGDEFEAELYQREKRDEQTGQLLDFAVGLAVRPADTDEDWVQVVRVDVAHGFVHVDRYSRDGTKAKVTGCVPEECARDIEAARAWAVNYVWDIEERMAAWT